MVIRRLTSPQGGGQQIDIINLFIMEPYVMHWLEGVENEYHTHHFVRDGNGKKTDYVYFVSRPKNMEDLKLNKDKVLTLSPEAASGSAMLADWETQEMREFVSKIIEYPRRIFADLFRDLPAKDEELAVKGVDINSISPLHCLNDQLGEQIKTSSFKEASKMTIYHQSLLSLSPSRRFKVDVRLPTSPPCRGLSEIFTEPDLAFYLYRSSRDGSREENRQNEHLI